MTSDRHPPLINLHAYSSVLGNFEGQNMQRKARLQDPKFTEEAAKCNYGKSYIKCFISTFDAALRLNRFISSPCQNYFNHGSYIIWPICFTWLFYMRHPWINLWGMENTAELSDPWGNRCQRLDCFATFSQLLHLTRNTQSVWHSSTSRGHKFCPLFKRPWMAQEQEHVYVLFVITPGKKTCVTCDAFWAENEDRRIRPFWPFVHRPKCVWCMETQTKPTATGMGLSTIASLYGMCHAP